LLDVNENKSYGSFIAFHYHSEKKRDFDACQIKQKPCTKMEWDAFIKEMMEE